MIKNKIKIMLQFKNKLQLDLMDIWEMSSKQSLNNKVSQERITLQDMIKLCDYLGYEIEIKDKTTNKPLLSFDLSDLQKDDTYPSFEKKYNTKKVANRLQPTHTPSKKSTFSKKLRAFFIVFLQVW